MVFQRGRECFQPPFMEEGARAAENLARGVIVHLYTRLYKISKSRRFKFGRALHFVLFPAEVQ